LKSLKILVRIRIRIRIRQSKVRIRIRISTKMSRIGNTGFDNSPQNFTLLCAKDDLSEFLSLTMHHKKYFIIRQSREEGTVWVYCRYIVNLYGTVPVPRLITAGRATHTGTRYLLDKYRTGYLTLLGQLKTRIGQNGAYFRHYTKSGYYYSGSWLPFWRKEKKNVSKSVISVLN
jgi:hypothetical protein